MKKIAGLLFLLGVLGVKLSFAQNIAYIANNEFLEANHTIAICPIGDDASIGTCVQHTDRTFQLPVDVILNDNATVAYVANAFDNTISVCPVDAQGALAPCATFNDPNLLLARSGLRLNADNTLLYVTHYLYNGSISVCPVDNEGNLSACTSYRNQTFNGPAGRMVLDVSGEIAYVPNAHISSISICDTAFSTCKSIRERNLNTPSGLDLDASGRYLYLASNSSSSVLICPSDFRNLAPCAISRGNNTFGYPTFDFGDNVTNLFIRTNNGHGYIPNRGNNTVSVCPIDPATGGLDLCTAYDGGDAFINPTSVWVAEFN